MSSSRVQILRTLRDRGASRQKIAGAVAAYGKLPPNDHTKRDYTLIFEAVNRCGVPWYRNIQILEQLETETGVAPDVRSLNALLRILPMDAALSLLDERFEYMESITTLLRHAWANCNPNASTEQNSDEDVQNPAFNSTAMPPLLETDFQTNIKHGSATLPEGKIVPDSVTFMTILQKITKESIAARRRRAKTQGAVFNLPLHKQAILIVKHMRELDLLDSQALTVAIRCFSGAHWRECLQFVEEQCGLVQMHTDKIDDHFYPIPFDSFCASAAIDVIGRCGGVNHARFARSADSNEGCPTPFRATLRLYDEAKRSGCANLVVHNATLCAFANCREWTACLDLLSAMLPVNGMEEQGSPSSSGRNGVTIRDARGTGDDSRRKLGYAAADTFSADAFSFAIVINALPASEFALGLNLLQRMGELKILPNEHVAFSTLHLLQRHANLQNGGRNTSDENLKEALQASCGSKGYFFKIMSDWHQDIEALNSETIGHSQDSEIVDSKAPNPDSLESGSNDGPTHEKRIPVSRRLFPKKMLVDVEDRFDSADEKCLRLNATSTAIAKKLIKGSFHNLSWNEGMFRAGFDILLADADTLHHNGWQEALKLWKLRGDKIFPKATPTEVISTTHKASPTYRVDFHYDNGDKAHNVATAKVATLHALQELAGTRGKRAESFNNKENDGNTRDNGRNSNPRSNDQTDGTCGKDGIRLKIVTGKGQYVLHKAVMEFLTFAPEALSIGVTRFHQNESGEIHVQLDRGTDSSVQAHDQSSNGKTFR